MKYISVKSFYFKFGLVVQELAFKDIPYMQFLQPFSTAQFVQDWRTNEDLFNLCNYFEYGQVVQKMLFKGISYIQHWHQFGLVE